MTAVSKIRMLLNTARVKTIQANGGILHRIVEMPYTSALEPVMHPQVLSGKPPSSSCTCEMCSRLGKAGSSCEEAGSCR